MEARCKNQAVSHDKMRRLSEGRHQKVHRRRLASKWAWWGNVYHRKRKHDNVKIMVPSWVWNWSSVLYYFSSHCHRKNCKAGSQQRFVYQVKRRSCGGFMEVCGAVEWDKCAEKGFLKGYKCRIFTFKNVSQHHFKLLLDVFHDNSYENDSLLMALMWSCKC